MAILHRKQNVGRVLHLCGNIGLVRLAIQAVVYEQYGAFVRAQRGRHSFCVGVCAFPIRRDGRQTAKVAEQRNFFSSPSHSIRHGKVTEPSVFEMAEFTGGAKISSTGVRQLGRRVAISTAAASRNIL